MKIQIYFGLWLMFVAGIISVRADDNPAQAAARAALVKMLMDLNKPQTPAAPSNPPTASKPSWDVVEPSGESITAKTNPAPNPTPARVMAPQTVLAAPAPVVVPVAVTPVAVTPVPLVAAVKPQPAAMFVMPKPAPVIATVPKRTPPASVKPGKEIVTIYGTVYKNAEVEKVDSDGVIISYSTAGGGLGMCRVNFSDLPDEFRRQCEGY